MINDKLRNGTCWGLVMLCVVLSSGCASTSKTTRTETTVTSPSGAADHEEVVVEKTETTVTTESQPENPGVLSSALHAVGYVLILPFIIVGGLFKIIFGG